MLHVAADPTTQNTDFKVIAVQYKQSLLVTIRCCLLLTSAVTEGKRAQQWTDE